VLANHGAVMLSIRVNASGFSRSASPAAWSLSSVIMHASSSSLIADSFGEARFYSYKFGCWCGAVVSSLYRKEAQTRA
jgi:hypothetical protein